MNFDEKHILLHSCCAPCSAAIIEWLIINDYRPTIFFFNPNIFPEKEYLIRKNEILAFANKHSLTIYDEDVLGGDALSKEILRGDALSKDAPCEEALDENTSDAHILHSKARRSSALKTSASSTSWKHNHDLWLEQIKTVNDYSTQMERGSRCLKCFQIRMNASAKLANKLGIPLFTSTLASSRWKDLNQIIEAGTQACEPYPNIKFWDKNWKKGGLYERRNFLAKEFYNQNYCGCEFSIRPKLSSD